MIYIYIDGDDVGLKIENSLIENDEQRLQMVNLEIKEIIDKMTCLLISEGFTIIFSGADGIICKKDTANGSALLDLTRNLNCHYTFSLGLSNSLRNSFLALRYAKSINKNVAVTYENERFSITR